MGDFPFGGEAMRSGRNVRVGLLLAVLLVGAGTASSAEPLSASGGTSVRFLNPVEQAWAWLSSLAKETIAAWSGTEGTSSEPGTTPEDLDGLDGGAFIDPFGND
jgi:hypothetical protein